MSTPAPRHPGRDPRPFALISFMSNMPRSDSWHRIGQNFAHRLYLHLPHGGSRSKLVFAVSAWFPGGATISRPYLPLGRYQASLGHRRFFPTVSPAHTLVRRGGTQCLCLHSAGSTIPRLWPTGSSSGWLPSITTRWYSSSPSDSTSRWTPCPPVVSMTASELSASLGCVRRFQLRARLGYCLFKSPGP